MLGNSRTTEQAVLVHTESLLDRLSSQSHENIASATLIRGELHATCVRESIVRNISWLLSTTEFHASRDLSRWPHAKDSVLNFGVPEFQGLLNADVDPIEVSRSVERAIRLFEPRMIRETVSVHVFRDSQASSKRAFCLTVMGDFLDGDSQFSIELNAEIDPESGRIENLSS